ncbi:hypothetical protein GPALN_011447 [Globodera pallida]|nr:hypothetical protein GPALN_011447 [Globodera pallida]
MPFLCKICEANIGTKILEQQKVATDSPCPSTSASVGCEPNWRCSFCLGLLNDDELLEKIADEAAHQLRREGHEAVNFVLALNVPMSVLLREAVVERLVEPAWSPMSMSPKELLSRQLMAKISKTTGLRPSLNSDLILTVTLENDEFVQADFDFLVLNFSHEFMRAPASKKRRMQCTDQADMASSLLTKMKIKAARDQMDRAVANTFKLLPARRPCTCVSVVFERQPLFIGGRYCKYSRMLPQSPWIGAVNDEEAPTPTDVGIGTVPARLPPQNSVSEKIAGPLVRHFGADASRFIAAGREDIDVRMLGTGRPFAVQLLNVRKAACLRTHASAAATLAALCAQINAGERARDVSVHALAHVTAKQVQQLNVGQEEKRKTYSALCCTRTPLADDAPLRRLHTHAFPLQVAQRTVVRVLKRRPLLDRMRCVYAMHAFALDSHHFVLRLQTQAGTYVKEFVHSDFGRTRPSVAELMGVELGQVDIVQLDVLNVDLNWPPGEGEKVEQKPGTDGSEKQSITN